MLLSTFALCFWATAASAACNARTKIHYVRADDRSRSDYQHHTHYFRPERLQSRASSVFGASGSSAAAGFPYRFVFPANHPALSGPAYPEYHLQQPNSQQQQSEQQLQFSAEDMYTAPATAKHHPLLSGHKHVRQYPQNQQLGYDFFGGGGGKHQLPYHLVKQPKHYQSFELAPGGPAANLHQSPPYSVPSIAQPIMLLIPTSGQPGSPYQTLVLVPSSAAGNPPPPPPPQQNPIFSGYQQPQIQHLQHAAPPQYLHPGFVTHPRGAPMMTGGYPSANGLGKFPGTAQIVHRSHEPHHQQQQQQQQHQHQVVHQQYKQQQQQPSAPSQPPATSYQSSGSAAHVMSHAKSAGPPRPNPQPLEDKVSESTGASGESSDGSGETKSGEKESSPEFGDRTSAKPPPKRIVVT